MGKLVESTLVSLDGVIEAPQGWAVFGEDSKAIALENLAGYEAFVLGRASYEMFYASWSRLHGDPYIEAINAKRKYVLSTTLVIVDWNAELLRGVDQLASRKDQTDGTLIKYGTGALTRGLLEHRLIDEFQWPSHRSSSARASGCSPMSGRPCHDWNSSTARALLPAS